MPFTHPNRVRRTQNWCFRGILLLIILALTCGMVASPDNYQSEGCTPAKRIPAALEDCGRNNPTMIDPYGIPIIYADIGTDVRDQSVGGEICIQYSDADLDGLNESGLTIGCYINGAWEPLESTIDSANDTITAIVPSAAASTPTSTFTLALVYNGTSVNTDRSTYRAGDVARITIVVLNRAGAPARNSTIEILIDAPDGTYHYSTADQTIVPTDRDGVYEAYHETTVEGFYNVSCTAVVDCESNRFGTHFIVQSGYDFEIIRTAESVIDPTKHDRFDVTIDVISHTNASETVIWEYVPANFTVFTDADVIDAGSIKILTWQRNVTDGATSVNYSYSVPMEYPLLYQLGPVEVDYGDEAFREARTWYVAVDPDPAWSVQSGRTTITAGSTSRDVALDRPIADTGKAFLLMDSSGDSGAGQGGRHQATGYIMNATTLRFDRGVGMDDCKISWYVIECPDCSVQRGEVLFETGLAANTTTITPVDTSRSIVILHSRMNGDNDKIHRGYFTGNLSSTTTLYCERGATGTPATCRYEVVEFGTDTVVYTDETELPANKVSVTANIGGTVDTSRAWLYSTYRCSSNGLLDTSIGSELISNTHAKFWRYKKHPTNWIRWYVIEFPEGINVQRGYVDGRSNSADLTLDIKISQVNPSRSFSFVTSTSDGTGTAFPRNRWIEEFVNPTTLRLERWYSGQEYEHWWQVIEFLDTEPPAINRVILNTTTPDTGDLILVTVNATDDTGVIS
ncbi:MAG TPA: hypothetical protein ENF24_03470, partial [Methanosarcinales archaeon]|nr:hypothetical protein [Methanosarcinales archaeon]